MLFFSCGVTKNLKEDEQLLYSSTLKVDRPQDIKIEELQTNISQKPNRKLFFFFPTYLWVYNLYKTENVEQRNQKKRLKLEAKNAKRTAKGKQEREYKPVWGDRIRNGIGEKPVIFDSLEMERSVTQMKLYLEQAGYYRSTIETDVKNTRLYHRNKKLKATYKVKIGPPTVINKFNFKIEDYDIYQKNAEIVNGTLLHKQDPLNIETLEKERERLTIAMRNSGYYYFSQDYVSFEVDTNQAPQQAQVKEILENPYEQFQTANGSDSLVVQKHLKYRIRDIYINASYDPRFPNNVEDSLHTQGYIFTNKAQLRYKPKMLLKSIFIRPGTDYSLEAQEYTYRRLNALRNFRFVNIRYVDVPGTNELDCYINLTPALPQSLAVESEGTNTGGNLGIAGSLNYTHRNIFKGTEQLGIKLRGGFESQPTTNTGGSEEDGSAVTIGDLKLFNTIEYGIDFSLNIPELLIPKNIYTFKLPNYENPKTIFNVNFNFQQRPDYTRSLINGSYAYQWNALTKQTNFFTIQPVGVSLIKIDKSQEFQDRLDEINNPFYTSTYSDQLIVGTKSTYTWTNQNLRLNRNFAYNRVQAETAGNALVLANNLLGTEKVDGYYEIDSIQFAQYIKFDNDFRWYNVLTQNSKAVYRIYAGVGFPYGNLNVMPFDKSFFAGGSNDIRAWTARSLGPGSMPDSLKQGIDQVGDIIIEFNMEYRLKLTPTLEGALFADIGNIWLHPRDDRPEEAHFQLDDFYKEFAIGIGPGLRFDFSFLLLRLDLGFQFHDPAQAPGERWVFQPKDKYNAVHNRDYTLQYTLNLGIDYPF